MIKNLLSSAFTVALSIENFIVVADDHQKQEAPASIQPAGANTFSCNFLPGKDMDDYMRVIGKYNKQADENYPNPQSAWIFIPKFVENREHDFYWVGASPSMLEAAPNMDVWMKNGTDLVKQFQKVVDCDQS